MAKRGRKPKNKLNLNTQRGVFSSLLGLLLFLAAGVVAFSFLSHWLGSSTSFGSLLGGLLDESLGVSTLILPFIFVLLGFKSLGLNWRILKLRILIGILLLLGSFIGLTGSASGVVGLETRSFMSSLISSAGAIFFFFILFIISIVLITNSGIAPLFEKIGDILSGIARALGPVVKKFLPDSDFVDQKSLESSNQLNLDVEPTLTALPTVSNLDVGVVDDFKVSNLSDLDEISPSMENYDLNNYASPSLDYSYESATLGDLPGGNLIAKKLEENESFKLIKNPVSPTSESNLMSESVVEDIPLYNSNVVVTESDVAREQIELAMLEVDNISTPQVVAHKKVKPEGLPFSNKVWEYPSLNLLNDNPNRGADAGNVAERAKMIEHTLNAFGINAKVADTRVGPAVTQYALSVAIGTKSSKIQNISTDLALRIKSPSGSVRIEAPIPGTDLIGIEVPNNSPSLVTLKSVLTSQEFKNHKGRLKVPIGHTVSGRALIYDIAKMPHVLVAGSTGSGKSVMMNAIIASLLYNNSPQECRLIMIDPKFVEFVQYNDIPHLLTPVITDVEQKAVSALAWAVSEMERRYKLFANAGVRNIEGFNAKSGFQAEPYIVILIDELADMMMVASNDVEKYITRIAQKARAVGIHLVLATQRPSVNILTGMIKANIPTRIAFKVSSNTDSRVILDQVGAEVLIGRGDMLFVPPTDAKPQRIQGVFVDDKEIENLVNFLKSQGNGPSYNDDIVNQQVNVKDDGYSGSSTDEKFAEALEIICSDGKASASHLQRRLGIGYTRAARMIDDMEAMGVIGQARGSKPRDVLITSPDDVLGSKSN